MLPFSMMTAQLAAMTIVTMPHYFRSALHEREISATDRSAIVAAAKDPAEGVAILCGRQIELDHGSICEPVKDNDIDDAHARLVLRMSRAVAYIDGDTMFPRVATLPRLVDLGEENYGVEDHIFKGAQKELRPLMTHEHACPVVKHAAFGRVQERDHKLCVDVETTDTWWSSKGNEVRTFMAKSTWLAALYAALRVLVG